MRQGYDQQSYQGDWCGDRYCPHYPSQRVEGCDDVVGDEARDDCDGNCGGDDDANGSKDSYNPNNKDCSNHSANPYSNSSRMDYSHSIRSSHSGKDFSIHSTNYR